jgi:hypothetical protein
MKRFIASMLLGTGLIVGSALAAETPQELFQKALVKERSEGKLREEIPLYEKAAQSAGKDRALAARALVQAGECYQKLGDAESRKLFDRVVRDYADQRESVTIARARLGANTAAHSDGLVTRQVWKGPKVNPWGSSVSPDGRFISFTDWETGDLAIHDSALVQTAA